MLKPERTLQKLRNQEPVTIVNIGDSTSVVTHATHGRHNWFTYKNEAANPQNLCMRMMDTVHPNAIGHLALFRELAPTFEVPLFFPWEEVPVALAQSPLK